MKSRSGRKMYHYPRPQEVVAVTGLRYRYDKIYSRVPFSRPRGPCHDGDRMHTPRTAALLALLVTFASQTAQAQKNPPKPKPPEPPLTQLVDKYFARWDRDHNDVLE